MKKQFIPIVCTLIAFHIFCLNAQGQDFAVANVSPYSVVHKLMASGKNSAKPATALDLSGKDLTEIPTEAFNSSADIITLDNNLLNELPANIGQWTQCRQLFVRYNWLIAFPDGAAQMTSLELMDLTRNQIDVLPACVGKLSTMKKLVLDLNFLSSLPKELGRMQALQELSIRQNVLCCLPAEIGQLKNLEVLSLTNNNLETLPAEIGELTKLRILRLDFNNIQELPATLAKLQGNLKLLVIKGNPMGKQWLSEIKAMLPNTQVEF